MTSEYAENEIRKDFTPSERVAIADAVKQELGERRGRPSDPEKVPPVEQFAGRKTHDIAAERAGFGSAEITVEDIKRAKLAARDGSPLLNAMLNATAVRGERGGKD